MISAVAVQGGIGTAKGEDMLTTMAQLLSMHFNQLHCCSLHGMPPRSCKALLALSR